MICRPIGSPLFVKPQGCASAGQAGEVRRDREHVGEVHLQRIAHALAEAKRRDRRGRRHDDVALGERRREVVRDLAPHAQRLAVVGVVVAGAQHVGAEHDAALGLGAEALAARARVQLVERARSVARWP